MSEMFGNSTSKGDRWFKKTTDLLVENGNSPSGGIEGLKASVKSNEKESRKNREELKTKLLTPSINKTIRKYYTEIGANKTHIELIQEKLNELGYKLESDGVYGKITLKSIKTFQISKGLFPDGLVGDLTLKKMGFVNSKEFYGNNIIENTGYVSRMRNRNSIIKNPSYPYPEKHFTLPIDDTYIAIPTSENVDYSKYRSNTK